VTTRQLLDDVREIWERAFLHFPDRFRFEHRDLEVLVSGDLAFV